jgi:hypothetical protein
MVARLSHAGGYSLMPRTSPAAFARGVSGCQLSPYPLVSFPSSTLDAQIVVTCNLFVSSSARCTTGYTSRSLLHASYTLRTTTILQYPLHSSFDTTFFALAQVQQIHRARSYHTRTNPSNTRTKKIPQSAIQHALLNRHGASHPPCRPGCRSVNQTQPSTPSHEEGGPAIRC